MASTISGLDSVVVSPTSPKLEIAAMTLRMIFPERVLGMSETIQTCVGRAIFPMWVSMALATFSSMAVLGLNPGLSATYISTCLLYTSDAADDLLCVDLGGSR